MNLRFYIIIIVIFCSLALRAQVPFTDYPTQFPNNDFGFGNAIQNQISKGNNDIFMGGNISFNFQQFPFIFEKNASSLTSLKVYYSSAQTRMESIHFNQLLKTGYVFISTDGTIGCGSAGLKVLKINKTNLAALDSAFFCDPTKPSSGPGFFIHNHFYITSRFAQGFPAPLPPNYSKNRNLIRKIDTNLVMLNEQLIGDTSVNFGSYFLREAMDTGIIMNTINETEYCPMLIKLDTMGVEQWRKTYYPNSQTDCGTSAGEGIMGLQNYQNGYIALFNLGYGCSTNYFYSQSIMAKIDRQGNLVKEVQYTTAGDTTLEFYSNFTNYTKRTEFYSILIKTNDGNFASVISEREKYGFNQHENYIVLLDTNLNIIHKSPPLGSLSDLYGSGLIQTEDSTFYLCGSVRISQAQDGMNVRVYTYKIGGQVGVMEYKNETQFKIYPNPVINELNIELDEEPQLISIHNSMGQLVYSQTHNGILKINVSNWSKGVYFVELRNTKTSAKQSQKFIIE